MAGGLDEEAADDMHLAVGEVLLNIHRHAYSGRVGPVWVHVFKFDRQVTTVVMDRGDATEVPGVPSRLPPHSLRGGRGLYLARRLTDNLVIRVNRIGHGLSVRLTKRFHPVADDAEWRSLGFPAS
jgi:anti-sigma regulatory factor (Ser/Thr protein kinase)